MKTNKIKKVLIVLDYDPTAQKVAETGFSLAKSMGAEVKLLHVYTDAIAYTSPGHVTIMGFSGYMEADTNAIQEVGSDKLKKASYVFLDKTKHHLDDQTIETIVEEGNVAETIIKIAKDIHADVIVIGSHSHRWLEEILMGSVTEKVLRHATIPVFIVPTKKNE